MRVLRLVAGVAVASALVTGIGAAPAPAAPAPVDWGACEHGAPTGFTCGTLDVPMDRDDPSAGTVTLALTRLPATSDDRLGAIIYNPGGPAQAGRPALWGIGPLVAEDVRAHWDLVAWDPRGTGGTTPALRGCRAVGLSRLDLPATGAVDWDAALARARALVGARNAACLHANPLLGRHAGSVDAADDVDAIRAALHDDQAGYWGLSYGTTIGYTLALRHPEQLSRLYLDSTVNPSAGLGAVLDSFSWAIGPSLTFLSQASPRAFATWQSDVTTLSSGAIALPGGRRMTRWDAYLLLKLDPTVAGAALIHAAVSGDAKAGAVVAQSLEAVDAIGLWGGLRSLIICTDHPERPAAPAGRALLARSGRMAGDMGKMLAVGTAAMCAGLPRELGEPVPLLGFRESAVPALIAASTADQAVLFSGAVNMANGFSDGRLVSVVGNTHGLWNMGRSACLDRYVNRYFVSGTLPRTAAACP